LPNGSREASSPPARLCCSRREPDVTFLQSIQASRATDLQQQLRAAHQHLGVPPLDYLIAAVAEDHGASILHYDADFERLAANTDLAVTVEALAPLGSMP
jgi:hypothetical protein